MANSEGESKQPPMETGIKDMKIKTDNSSDEEKKNTLSHVKLEARGRNESGENSPVKKDSKSRTQSPQKRDGGSDYSPTMPLGEHEEIIGGEITLKQEPGQPPKLARSSTQKVMAKPTPLFDHYPDRTSEATSIFEVIRDCTYSNKSLGSTEHAMECDCNEEWGKNFPTSF
jgi:hypothetical protein